MKMIGLGCDLINKKIEKKLKFIYNINRIRKGEKDGYSNGF